jgi:hypothetical protein
MLDVIAMYALDKYPDVMTVKEVADYLRVKPSTVYGIKGLRKIRLGEGKGFIRILRDDFIVYIKSCSVMTGEDGHANLETKRQRKMGLPSLLSWKELQKIQFQYAR